MIKTFIASVLITLTFTQSISAQDDLDKALKTINRNTLEAQLSFLSSDWFQGREATTEGAYMAADYLASLYQTYGLSPFDNTQYFQEVPLLIAHPPKAASITLTNGIQSITYTSATDLVAERVAQSHTQEAELIWGGYGIHSASLKEINTKKSRNKILIRLAGLPEVKEGSALDKLLNTKNAQEWQQVKHTTLESAGVIAVLEYDPQASDAGIITAKEPFIEAAAEKTLSKRSSGIYQKNLYLPNETQKSPVVYKVSKRIMQQLIPNFDDALTHYHNELQNLSTKQAPTLSFGMAKLNTTANVEAKKCRNVLAMIKGSEKPEEVIVVGAHYDHLGHYNGYIWNGADDNGSGAIGVVAIARAFMATGVQPKRTVIFANWTAEERGLLGSRYFVNTYPHMAKVKYYHNYDMIGRSYDYEKPDSSVSLLYTKTWQQAETLCKHYNKDYDLGLKINYSAWDNPTSGSDNAPFAKEGIPIMWFHTGGHESYHQPSDHVERIDWQKFEAIVKTSFLTLWNLANE
ncbi:MULTISPECIES: M28 family metallopeptidase [unclassified Carboxylicivirga]|uniref:M28 family metallopeptidase n=1 Tax=Carboxylicivirga TaxID=1628153 RepID=UPI003D3319FA